MKWFMLCVVPVLALGSSGCSIRVHPGGAKDIMLDPEVLHTIIDAAAIIDSAK